MTLDDALKYGLEAPVGPRYSIYRYTDQIYKVIKFRSTKPRSGPQGGVTESTGSDSGESSDQAPVSDLHSSISRAKRVILEISLCNQWEYFCTFTLNPSFDRYNLHAWYKQFSQFIRDQRKKHNSKIAFLLVPEMHQNGAWHIHGLFTDPPPLVPFSERLAAGENVPIDLARNNFFSWPDYEKRFGFNSFGIIRNSVACAFYISKYVSKSIDSECINSGAHRYYASHGLARSSKHGDVYFDSQYLDSFLCNHYDFCSTGMTKLSDDLDFSFGFDYFPPPDGFETFSVDDVSQSEAVLFDTYFDFIQSRMEGF